MVASLASAQSSNTDQVAVPAAQHPVGDEERSELVDQVGAGQPVEGAVVERESAGGEIGERLRHQGENEAELT